MIILGNGDMGIVNVKGEIDTGETVAGIGFHKLDESVGIGDDTSNLAPIDVRELSYTIVATKVESLHVLRKAIDRAIEDFAQV